MKNQAENIKIVPFGCRLNTLESEKIRAMLAAAGVTDAIIVNTCAVTGEAERQSRQMVRKLSRENPLTPIYITGCAATRCASDYAEIKGVAAVVPNRDKFNLSAYGITCGPAPTSNLKLQTSNLSKGFVQIQNGCNHHCTYCITRLLRGPDVSFPYEKILADVRALVDSGYHEIVLTGVDIAGYNLPAPRRAPTKTKFSRGGLAGRDSFSYERSELEKLGWGENYDNPTQDSLTRCARKPSLSRPASGAGWRISDLCRALLHDVPELKRLRLSSLDPGVDQRPIVDLMNENPRMLPHLHLSMQSGADAILAAMARRHNVQMVRDLVTYANPVTCHLSPVTFSWDLICGFPGETPELFAATCELIRELKPIRVHAFPFSPRPGTPAATMPGQIDRAESKRRVKIALGLAHENRLEFMKSQIGKTASVLVEENNIARDVNDIPVKIAGPKIPPRTIMDVKITGIGRGPEHYFTAQNI